MKSVLTKDGSITFFNEEVGDHYHSLSGAFDEALKKHVLPSDFISREGPVHILDACFGLGYNTVVAISLWQDFQKPFPLKITAIDIDRQVALAGLETITSPACMYAKEFCQELVMHPGVKHTAPSLSGVFFHDSLQDRLALLPANSFDIVFFDPFAPQKQPEMWSLDMCKEVFRVMSSGSVLTTYSCARMVRDNLKAAGFEVRDGPCVGRRSPSTVAHKH